MTLFVPFDGSELATTALEKAATFGELLDEDVLVVTVIPDDPQYAVERGWITDGEPFNSDEIAAGLQTQAGEIAPNATVRIERVSSDEPTATARTTVVREIRQVATDVEASIVFIGSKNAGSVIAPPSSVGGTVAGDHRYDVYVVRHPAIDVDPEEIADIDSMID